MKMRIWACLSTLQRRYVLGIRRWPLVTQLVDLLCFKFRFGLKAFFFALGGLIPHSSALVLTCDCVVLVYISRVQDLARSREASPTKLVMVIVRGHLQSSECTEVDGQYLHGGCLRSHFQ